MSSGRPGRRSDIAAYETLLSLRLRSLSTVELMPYAHFHFRDAVCSVSRIFLRLSEMGKFGSAARGKFSSDCHDLWERSQIEGTFTDVESMNAC